MGSCCFTGKNPGENTPLVEHNEVQNDSTLYGHSEIGTQTLEEQKETKPVVATGVGKKRTSPQRQEGPPEKALAPAPAMSDDDSDLCDGVPLHLPMDVASAAIDGMTPYYASNSRIGNMFFTLKPIMRTTCIGGISQRSQKCPYCDNEGGNTFFFLTMAHCSHQLLEKLYQAGWWRTGTICFKPDIRKVCCPNYSIRLEVSKYVMSKSQRAIVRKFKNFLCNGDTHWEGDTPAVSSLPHPQQNINNTSDLGMKDSTKKQKQKRPVQPGKGADPSKPPCRKAKEIRKEKWKEKQKKLHGEVASTCTPKQPQKPKTVEEILADVDTSVPGQKHRFRQEIVSCNPLSPKLTSLLAREYELYCKFQDSVHSGKSRFHSYDEFVWGFVESVVTNEDNKVTGVKIGTYHIHYYLDDELVMVTIADITPTLFISIYFFYDPKIRFIHPGIYTVIREIALTRQLQKVMPDLKYYVLGYYNFTIPKISYKQQFRPTEIQCPDTYHWLPLERVLPRITANQYTRLSDEEYDPEIDKTVNDLMVSLYSMPALRYGSLPPDAQLKREMLAKLVQEFGSFGISNEIILNLTSNIDI